MVFFKPMILIFAKAQTPRLQYTLELLFETIMDTKVLLCSDKDEFMLSDLPKINYSDENLHSGLFLKAQLLLFSNDIAPQNPQELEMDGSPVFFSSSDDSFLPFDVFAASFYVASRYEEYLYTGKADHGRFPARESILHRHNLLHQPVVNQWAELLFRKLQQAYPQLQALEKRFRFQATIDIDNAWAYKNKSWTIQLGAIGKAFLQHRTEDIHSRLNVLSGKQNDPFDTYDFIEHTFSGKPDRLKLFFLLGNRSRYDRNISHRNENFRKLIQRFAATFELGIHPSYASASKKQLLQTEKKRMEKIIGKPVTNSRQHFLMLKIPQTYERLIQAGISHDYTMGYSEIIGFRAGLCTPFRFFNLKKNRAENLTIHPFQVMDVSLKNYLGLKPEEALRSIFQLMEETKKVNGIFTCLWHNESLGDENSWANWQDVFRQMVEKGKALENE